MMNEELEAALLKGLVEKIQTLAHITGVERVDWDSMNDQGLIKLQTPRHVFHVSIAPEAISMLRSALDELEELRPDLTQQ